MRNEGGVPAAVVEELRDAVAMLNTDSEFAAEAQKVLDSVPLYATGSDLDARIKKSLTVPAEMKNFIKEYMRRATSK